MAEDWPSGRNEDQIFSRDGSGQLPFATPVDADGAIHDNLYCLRCGYNLRGLYGDPVRCPECGAWNDLGTVRIPAQHLESALRQMETWPTSSVASSLLCMGSLTIVVFAGWTAQVIFLILAGIFTLGWLASVLRMRSEFADREGWQSILLRFHVAAGLFVLEAVFAVMASLHLSEYGIGSGNYMPILPAVAGVPLVWVALRIYRPARDMLREMQRDRAITVARRMIRDLLSNRPTMLLACGVTIIEIGIS